MKKLLLLPGCALLALGVLTSCQKEDKTAQQLADELTAELQKVTNYKTAEAAAPRVEVLNKRFQNASVRVCSAGSNALTDSSTNAYAESVCNLAREIGRVKSSKPVTEAEGEVDEALLLQAIGAASGAAVTDPAKTQAAKGKAFLRNENVKENNNPPTLDECYGSKKLRDALSYTADVADFPATRFDTDADVPAIPAAVEPAEDEEPAAAETEDETPAATTTAADEDDTTPAPAADSDDDDSSSSSSDDEDTTTSSSDDDDSSSSDDDSSSSSSDDDDDDDASIDIDL